MPPAVGVHVFLDKGRAADGQPQHGEGTLRGGSGDSETVWVLRSSGESHMSPGGGNKSQTGQGLPPWHRLTAH